MTFRTKKPILAISATALGLGLIACGANADTNETAVTIKSEATATASQNVQKVARVEVDKMKMAEGDKMKMKTVDSDATDMNAPFNAFLAKYVSVKDGINLVDYAGVTDADKAALDGYIDTLSMTDISSYSDDAKKAYWFNLYNAKTVAVILANYPTKSIKKIGRGGPWKQKILTVNGKAMSLDNIEHDTVRKLYDEPRIHFAFNCASIGCPNLKTTAWEAATLDADLTQAARDFVGSPRGVSVDDDGDVDASKIFKWYADDFGANEKAVLTYLAQFADGPKKAAMLAAKKVDDYDYDWSLNAATK